MIDTKEPPKSPSSHGPRPTVDEAEVERFERMAAEWWDPKGKFRPLHQIGPARLAYIRDRALAHFGRAPGGLRPLDGLSVLDIGCGGGLISEPLARMGATVTGIDPGERNIRIARSHADPQGLAITYRCGTAEDLAAEGAQFDVVACLEVVEHVPDPAAFIGTCAGLVRPGGLMVASTINRNLKSYALAIIAAEYILGWLPRGTHQWDRFITPGELAGFMTAAGLSAPEFEGYVYHPLADTWQLSADTDVNYLAAAAKPAHG
jgi:2-polyprenyl-6-hydroxyphenyl methylase/3-demethylubiquinone-9 3-methyltransferase